MINPIGSGVSSLAAQLGNLASPGAAGAGAGASNGGFGAVFQAAIQNVDHLQAGADTQISNLIQGAPNTDVSNVMVSVEKADVAFQLMMQVRNKIVSAYQDIEKMQF